TLWQRVAGVWVNRSAHELSQTKAAPGGGTLGGTETAQASITVPPIAFPHRLRFQFCCNFSNVAATAGTVDTHIRYNTTGGVAVVGDTMARQARISLPATAGAQQGVFCAGSIDRAGAGGTTTVSAWALTSGMSVTIPNDATLAQLEVWAVPL
ncbi:MAG TPA: hypothetical protein VKB57_22920, partial [Acidimicrobiales bacterium]|nr:hypothetical protein [Acidimicrobiales bacterium]